MPGEILEWSGGKGRVRVHGEIWAATGAQPLALEPGDRVFITGRDRLTLLVAHST